MILLKGDAAGHCRRISDEYPEVHCLFVSIPVPDIINRLTRGKLNAYGMCLNHWLPLPVGIVLMNSSWLSDSQRLEEQYRIDRSSGYHPYCENPITYIARHEFAHVLYNRLSIKRRSKWETIFNDMRDKPSGYSLTPEECFCEAFASQGEWRYVAERLMNDPC